MSISQFIEEKSHQLCFYLRAFWQGTLNYQELNYFFWDTLEEWSLYRSDDLEPSTHKERVFWHLLHQIHYWREDPTERSLSARNRHYPGIPPVTSD